MGNSVLERWRQNGTQTRVLALPRGRHSVRVLPTSVGYERLRSSHYDWDGQRRGATPFGLIQHTLSGRGRLRFEGRTQSVGAGQTMVLSFPHDHRYWLEPGDDWEFCWVVVTGREALRIQNAVIAAAGPVIQPSFVATERLLEAVANLLSSKRLSVGMASSLAYGCSMALFDDVLGAARPLPDNQRTPTVERVVGHVRGHLNEPLNVEELARIAGCSRWHLTRLFKRERGVSPAEFVLNERLKHAAHRMADRTLSVGDIAHATGFRDPNYFAKAFRRHFGVSPTEFRDSGIYLKR